MYFSSVRTWAVVSSVPVSIECDMKSLLSSYSFKASVLLNNQSTISAQVTTAEQRVHPKKIDSSCGYGVDY